MVGCSFVVDLGLLRTDPLAMVATWCGGAVGVGLRRNHAAVEPHVYTFSKERGEKTGQVHTSFVAWYKALTPLGLVLITAPLATCAANKDMTPDLDRLVKRATSS